MPKGAMLSHKNILSACCNALIGSEPGQDVVYLFPFPLCHVAAYAVISNHLSGFPLVLMRRFDPEAFLASIGRYQATSAPMAPTMINFVLQHPKIDDYDYGTLRDMGYGASAIPREVLKRAMDRFGNIFMQGFGMTELAGNVLFLSKDDHQRGLTEKPELLTAAGRPRPLAAVRVVDEGMNDVALGQVGEIVVRGDQVMMGYWEMPEATEAAFAGGWLHTGDMARIDEEGYFYVVDRLKDMIVTGGENVYPREVEQVIYGHPAVSEVAVIGLPDESWGENVVAVVALRKGTQATEQEIIGLCRDHLAGYKKPKRVEFVDELPKNVSGKILKRELRTRFG
jgi:long-chain acyl-CoA synthetase